MQYNKKVKLWLKSWFLMSHVSRVVSPLVFMVVSVVLMSLMFRVLSGLFPVVCPLFLFSCALCVSACRPIALFSMSVFLIPRACWFVRLAGIIAHSARPFSYNCFTL